MIATARCQQAAIRRKRHGPRAITMRLDRSERPAGARAPYANVVVATGRRNRLTIRRERYGADVALVPDSWWNLDLYQQLPYAQPDFRRFGLPQQTLQVVFDFVSQGGELQEGLLPDIEQVRVQVLH